MQGRRIDGKTAKGRYTVWVGLGQNPNGKYGVGKGVAGLVLSLLTTIKAWLINQHQRSLSNLNHS